MYWSLFRRRAIDVPIIFICYDNLWYLAECLETQKKKKKEEREVNTNFLTDANKTNAL